MQLFATVGGVSKMEQEDATFRSKASAPSPFGYAPQLPTKSIPKKETVRNNADGDFDGFFLRYG